MASSILSTLKNNNSDMIRNFQDFRRQLDASGQDPQTLLNSLINSGKVTNQQLQHAQNMARLFMNILPK